MHCSFKRSTSSRSGGLLFAFRESEDKDDEANDDEDDDNDQHNKIANEVKNGDMLLLTFEKLADDNNHNYGGDGDDENH